MYMSVLLVGKCTLAVSTLPNYHVRLVHMRVYCTRFISSLYSCTVYIYIQSAVPFELKPGRYELAEAPLRFCNPFEVIFL